MGVFAPTPYCPPETLTWVQEHILQPAVDGLRREGHPFIGVLYAGLILTPQGPKVLEFNCRFGDPETQVLLPLLDADLLEITLACTAGQLAEMKGKIRRREAAAVCVMLASEGYPGAYPKGKIISGVDALPKGVLAFHAGTALRDGQLVTNGGRVLGVTAIASSLKKARELA